MWGTDCRLQPPFPPSLFKQHKPILAGSYAHSELKGFQNLFMSAHTGCYHLCS